MKKMGAMMSNFIWRDFSKQWKLWHRIKDIPSKWTGPMSQRDISQGLGPRDVGGADIDHRRIVATITKAAYTLEHLPYKRRALLITALRELCDELDSRNAERS